MTDIVERLRSRMGQNFGRSTWATDPLCAEAADAIEASLRIMGEQSEQIERLRAENSILTTHLLEIVTQRERADRLQALIDAYAEAMQAVKGATLSNVHQLHDVLEVRANALLAAATPQEDAP